MNEHERNLLYLLGKQRLEDLKRYVEEHPQDDQAICQMYELEHALGGVEPH